MPRPTFLKKAKRVTLTIETPLHTEAVKRAKSYGFQGGFSEYVSRLLIADQRSKRGLASNTTRTFRPEAAIPAGKNFANGSN